MRHQLETVSAIGAAFWATALFTLCVVNLDGATLDPSLTPIQPSDTPMQYDASKVPILDWIFQHIAEGGFSVPKDGETFKFSDYFDAVPDRVPKKYDIAFFTESGERKAGLVSEVEGNTLLIHEPLGAGMFLYISKTIDEIKGFLRPNKPATVAPHGAAFKI